MEHIMLLTPLLVLFIIVKERHFFLEQTIGAIPHEWDTVYQVRALLIIGIASVCLLLATQLLLFWLYNYYGHPWNRFFKEFFTDNGILLYGHVNSKNFQNNIRDVQKGHENHNKFENERNFDQMSSSVSSTEGEHLNMEEDNGLLQG